MKDEPGKRVGGGRLEKEGKKFTNNQSLYNYIFSF